MVPHKDANNHKDSYGKLAYGNLNLALAPSDRKKPEDAERAKEKLLKVSSSFAPQTSKRAQSLYLLSPS